MAFVTAENTSRFVTVEVNDTAFRVHYNDCGDSSDSSETVVMIHGSGPGASGWANFHKNVQPFTEAGYRVLLIDCLGWGESDPIVNSGSRSGLNARVVKGVLDRLHIDKIYLVGNSMGAHSSVAFTLAYPSYADKLVLMGGGAGGINVLGPSPSEGMKIVNQCYREPTLESLERFNRVFVYDSSTLTPDLMQLRLQNMLNRKQHLDNFLQSLALHPKQYPDVTARLPEIQQKTLIIWGIQDRVMPVEGALRLAAGIPGSELHLFNQCGHWAQWEHADRFNSLVIDFLHA